MRLAFDIETTNLLDSNTIDYTCSPYKLRDDYRIHCAVFKDIDEGSYYEFVQEDCYTKMVPWLRRNATTLIGNNIIAFDLLALKLALPDFDYTVGPDTICGKPCKIFDNMVVSKCLNPDRPAHTVEYFGKLLRLEKIDWRGKAVEVGLIAADAPKGAEFRVYHPELLVYNRRDADVSAKIYNMLQQEIGKWDWQDAIDLEHAVRDIITRQEHRGFWFDVDKAVEHVKELDTRMENLRAIVEPLIPPKPIGKTAAKEYIPCKNQFKKDGSLSANIIKWVGKHGGTIAEDNTTELYGKVYKIPIPQEPIITHVTAKINDTTHIKGWLKTLGWVPSAYKERDLTVGSKKHKLTKEQFIETCDRYIAQTLSSPFKDDRMEALEVYSEEGFKKKLYRHEHLKRPLKVYTNPALTVGMEKEIDPALLAMSDRFAHAKDVSDYLTYQHRRNSILGGGVDPDDDDEEMHKGWMSVDRISHDHRIPTPADTCGAGTSRFKHRVVVNIPRVMSPFGKEMRELFGTSDECYQVGYDFDGLEARMESHYCHKFDNEEKSYCKSLLGEKPNDVHTLTSIVIADALGRPFGRTPSKNVKYGCTYGARPKRVAKTIGCSIEDGETVFNAFWLAAQPLAKLMDSTTRWWEEYGTKKFIKGIDGRKIPTRSASALINSLFQSAGVICAKRAMVIHDRKLRDEGLLVDFFREDWANVDFCQQMIAMHDEAQLEVTKGQVKWKMFPTEEEAKAFKRENPTWSDVGHSAKGYYVGYCRAGELAIESVKEAGEYYKLNVELTAGYMLGTNWATCH